ncbi:MAG: hypothetical protein ACFFB2_12110 [Promethearchaeota archaeon]
MVKHPKFVTSLAIIGDSFDQWKNIKKLCDQSTQSYGLGLGILSRTIETDLGYFPVKFLVIFIEKKFTHNIKPTFKFTMNEITNEGIENILTRIGRKTIIKAHINMKTKISQL